MCRFDHNTYVLVGIYDRLFQKNLMQLTNTVSHGVSFISWSDGRPFPCSIHIIVWVVLEQSQSQWGFIVIKGVS